MLKYSILFNKIKTTLILRQPFCHKQKMSPKGREEGKGRRKHPQNKFQATALENHT